MAIKCTSGFHLLIILPEAGSFVSKIDLGQDKLIDTNNPVCFGNYHAF
jgi:hypothetical protein